METKEPKIVVKIPVKPYMQKFLEFYLSKTYELRQDDAYGVFLFVLFQKRPAKGERAGSIKRYTASFDVCGSKHQLRKAGYKGLTNLTTVQFNNFAEAIFKVEWHSFAASYHEVEGKSIRQAVDDFMQKFNLTPTEVDPMSLRRSFLRYRQDEEALKLHREKHGLAAA